MGFFPLQTSSNSPNFPQPGFVHSACQEGVWDALQSAVNGENKPRLRKVWQLGEVRAVTQIGYRTRFVG